MAGAYQQSFFRWDGDALVVNTLGKRGAGKDGFGKPKGARLRVSVTARPRQGRVTHRMVAFLAPLFGVRERDIEVVFGRESMRKQLPHHSPNGQRFSGLGTCPRTWARSKVDNRALALAQHGPANRWRDAHRAAIAHLPIFLMLSPHSSSNYIATLLRQRRWTFMLLALVLSVGQVNAKTPGQHGSVVQYAELRAELVAYAPQGVGADQALSLGLLLEHQPGWHTYWVNPGDSGLPTELQWTLPSGAQAGAVAWPVPQKIKIGALANLGYEGQVLLPVPVRIPKGFRPQGSTFDVQLHASWLVCRQECIPQEGRFSLAIPVQGSSAMHSALFEAAVQKRTTPLGGQISGEFVAEGLLLRAKGLPLAWQGKAISVFPETSSVFATPALPDAHDKVVAASPSGKDSFAIAKQVWDADAWAAVLPLSPQRVSGPDSLPLVLAFGGESVRATVAVPGPWPEATQKNSPPGEVSDLNLSKTPDSISSPVSLAFWGAVLAAFAGGLLLNLMPCVFPVLALKALGLATLQASAAQRRAQAAAYAGGVIVSMLVLGALLLTLRAGGQALGWGFHLQSPVFIAALTVLFTLICLNLMDLLDVSQLIPGDLAGLRLRNPVSDAALSGVLAVLVASPCTAPFMGASLGLAMSLPGWQAMLVFVALGLGLALPYALVSNSTVLARLLPKPGLWMEHLRRFMVFPMAATVLWLVWVFAQMTGLDRAALLVAMLLCLSMCLWALHLPRRAAMGFGLVALLISFAIGSLAWRIASQSNGQTSEEQKSRKMPLWQDWTARAEKSALASGRPVFVDFTAAWCITCQYNEQQVLAKPQVLQAFAGKRVVLMRADWTRRDAAISQALERLGRSGVPVYVLQVPGRTPVLMSELLSTDDVLAAISDI